MLAIWWRWRRVNLLQQREPVRRSSYQTQGNSLIVLNGFPSPSIVWDLAYLSEVNLAKTRPGRGDRRPLPPSIPSCLRACTGPLSPSHSRQIILHVKVYYFSMYITFHGRTHRYRNGRVAVQRLRVSESRLSITAERNLADWHLCDPIVHDLDPGVQASESQQFFTDV